MDTLPPRPNHDAVRFRIACVLIFLIGTGLSLLAFFAAYAKAEQEEQNHFQGMAQSYVEALKASFDNCFDAVLAVGGLFEADDDIEQPEFSIYVNSIGEIAPGMRALEWAPWVPHASRAVFEQDAREVWPKYAITELAAPGKAVARKPSAEYFPVRMIAPYQGNEFAVGLDVASRPTRYAELQRARDSGQLTVSARLTQQDSSFLVIYPVYHQRTETTTVPLRRANLNGFVIGIFHIGAVVRAGLNSLPPGELAVAIYDGRQAQESRRLYGSHSHSRDFHGVATGLAPSLQRPLEHVSQLTAGGRPWTIHLTPAPGRFVAKVPPLAWIELIVGVLLSALLAGYVETIRRHQLAISRQNQHRNALITHFDYLVKYANDIIVLADDHGNIIEVNDRACNAYGYSREQLLEMKLQQLSVDELQQLLYLNMHGMGEEGLLYETVERRRDGSTFPVEVSARRIEIGGQFFWQAIARDISERKQQEQVLARVNRALRVLSECNAALVHAGSEKELLQEICRLIAEVGRYPMAWIGYAEDDECKTVRPVAHAGDTDGYLQQVAISWADNEQGQGPTGRAIRDGVPQINQHFADNPHLQAWRVRGIQHGFQASIAVPLRSAARVFGVMMIYATEPNAFDAEEVTLLQELADDLGFGIASLREAQERQRIQSELDYQANYDALTGLPNRNLLDSQLQLALTRAGGAERQLAVLMLYLDRFDTINDGLGHAAGDALLKYVAKQLLSTLGVGDSAAHFAGSEFAVLLCDVEQQEQLVTRVRHLLEAVSVPFDMDDQQIYTTASVGVALYPKDGDSPDTLLRNAAAAMYRAKGEGGETFRFYAPEMNERVAAQLALEIDLRRGLERDELLVYYHPKVSLSTGRVIGAEALVRWQHPDKGLLMPAAFIGMAEETGLIQGVGEWVFQNVCRHLRQWREQGLPQLPIAVNLSARQFRQQDLVQQLQQAVASNGLDTKLLELEITESTLMEDADAAIATLRQLKELGFSMSLDDFGTGYSSLSYLKHLPLDHLKIDQSFVHNLTSEPDDAAICLAVIDLAHNLKLKVIAEGVETEGQLSYLCRHGCDMMQGYLFSPPLPAEGFTWLLNEGRSVTLPDQDHTVKTLVLLDDDESVLLQLEYLLKNSNYNVLSTKRAEEAFDLLATYPVQVVMSDQRMPGNMEGTEFLARVRELYPNVLRLLMTGSLDPKTFSDSINRGAIYKFVPKPWDDEQLLLQIDEAFRYYESMHGKG